MITPFTYWNNPKATEDAIRNGWLWTGDMGSLNHNGQLTLRNRPKDMIVTGGRNAYPREVEEVLLQHPGVEEVSVVIGLKDGDWGEFVVAAIVPSQNTIPTEGQLDELFISKIARFESQSATFT